MALSENTDEKCGVGVSCCESDRAQTPCLPSVLHMSSLSYPSSALFLCVCVFYNDPITHISNILLYFHD